MIFCSSMFNVLGGLIFNYFRIGILCDQDFTTFSTPHNDDYASQTDY